MLIAASSSPFKCTTWLRAQKAQTDRSKLYLSAGTCLVAVRAVDSGELVTRSVVASGHGPRHGR